MKMTESGSDHLIKKNFHPYWSVLVLLQIAYSQAAHIDATACLFTFPVFVTVSSIQSLLLKYLYKKYIKIHNIWEENFRFRPWIRNPWDSKSFCFTDLNQKHERWILSCLLYLFFEQYILLCRYYTMCPRSSDPFYIVSYYIKWVITSWTHSIYFFLSQNSGSKSTNI